MAAYSNCRLKKRKLDLYVAKADTELADSTITSPIVVRRAVDSEAAASTRRELRSARARATAGANSPGRTTRRRGRADITASLRMRPPPGRLRATRPCRYRPRHHGAAVWKRGEGPQRGSNGLSWNPERAGRGGRRRGVGDERTPGPDRFAERGAIPGHDPSFHYADLFPARRSPPEPPDLAGRPLGDRRAGGIVPVPHVDVPRSLQAVDVRLRCCIRLEGAMPIEVVGCQV